MASGDFDDDGEDDLAIGAYGTGEPGEPQRGAVEVSYGIELPSTKAKRRQFFSGGFVHGRFGKALAVVDWNADGIDDLAVGAPSASFSQLNATVPVDDAVRSQATLQLCQWSMGDSDRLLVIIVARQRLPGVGEGLYLHGFQDARAVASTGSSDRDAG
jgi:hypothetical protein